MRLFSNSSLLFSFTGEGNSDPTSPNWGMTYIKVRVLQPLAVPRRGFSSFFKFDAASVLKKGEKPWERGRASRIAFNHCL